MIALQHSSYKELLGDLKYLFQSHATQIDRQTWQGVSVAGRSDMLTHELVNVVFSLPLRHESISLYQEHMAPDLPWADDHFNERVCGFPLNPGVQWSKWRMGAGADAFRDADGRFNHNYMERYWPKVAQRIDPAKTVTSEVVVQTRQADTHRGIRYEYGDLDSVMDLLVRDPFTRQAYLPIFFPEDTGAAHGDRTPCSLGYHFMLVEGHLNCSYFLRSCDAANHFHNDMYLTTRLVLWILERLRERSPEMWGPVVPGELCVSISSFHLFNGNFHRFLGIKP